MADPSPSPVFRYSGAVISVAVMALFRFCLSPVLGTRQPFTAFYLAVMFSAWYGGLGAGVVATVLSCLVAELFFVVHLGKTGFFSAIDVTIFMTFMGVCSAIIAFNEAGRRTRRILEQEISDRKRAEDVIARDSMLLANVQDSVIVTDMEGVVTFWNRGAEQLFGWRSEELVGRPFVERLPQETRGAVQDWIKKIIEGAEFQGEWLDHHKDGHAVWIEASTRILRDAQGQPAGIMGISREIGARKEAEEYLRESQARLRQLADTMPQIVWTAGKTGSVEYFNDRWYEYTGMTTTQSLANDGWVSVIHPEDLPRLARRRDRAVKQGRLFDAEARLRDRDGHYRWHLIRSVPVYDEFGEVERRFGTATDIDDRRRAEESLRASEARYRAIYNQAAVGIAEMDLSGRFTGANARFQEIVGYSRDELARIAVDDILHPEERGTSILALETSGSQQESRTVEKRYWRKDGRLVWAATAVSVIRDGADRPARFVVVIEDITESKRLEDELRVRMEELAEANQRKTEFLAVLAHELRNPLAPIRNALYLMGHSGRLDGDAEAQRAMAERQVVHLARLVDDLMDVSRISRGKIELRLEEVELATVVKRAIESANTLLQERKLELELSLPSEPIRVMADVTRLRQVIWNVLNNAIKYSEPGGKIGITVEHGSGKVTLKIRDTGMGIDPEMLPRVFDMFVQSGRSMNRSDGGLGIGLSLVRTLVLMHGGHVEAASAGPGQGSEFTIELPMLTSDRMASEAQAGSNVVDALRTPPRHRVLVVDDNVDAATSLADILMTVHAQEVRVAHDGSSALEEALRFQPEVVLLDIGMAGIDGYEVARRLRRRPEHRDVLLVALTGWGQAADRRLSEEAGFDRHLVKPIEPEVLRDLLNQQRTGAGA